MPNYRLAARRAANKYKIDPRIFLRQIAAESGFDPRAKSPAGAQGIAQFIPSTAKAYGVNLNDNRVTDDLEGAAKYMAANLARTGGNYHRALSIYNSGRPEGFKSIGETRAYVDKILKGTGGTSQRGGGVSKSSSRTTTTPGVDNSAARAAAVQQFLGSKSADPVSFAMQIRGLRDIPGRTVTTTTSKSGSSPQSSSGSASSGTVNFEGKKVAAWIAPALTYAREHGWKGTVTSGFRSYADQQRIYNSGVRPAAKPGTSNHEGSRYPLGAVDVTDASTLSRILQSSPYGRKLVWAGAKDPVHFSHPHNGGY